MTPYAVTARTFRFRVQNPPGPDQLMRDLQQLVNPRDPPITEDDVVVVGLEIALDVTHPGVTDKRTLTDWAFHLVWYMAKPPAGELLVTGRAQRAPAEGARFVRSEMMYNATLNLGRDHLYRDANGLMRPVPIDEATLGPEDHLNAVRAYRKDYGIRVGAPAYHPEEDPRCWRARIERTLIGTASPFKTIDEWRAYCFTDLAQLFAVVQADPQASANMQMLVGAGDRLGVVVDEELRSSHRRIRKRGTRRDRELNDKIRTSLRKLTTSQKCGNSDANKGLKPRSSEGTPGEDGGVLNIETTALTVW